MREWLTQALLDSAEFLPEEAEGYVLGRGLPWRYTEEMRVGVWRCPHTPAPDATYAYRNGPKGHRVDHWLSIPLWSPRGRVVGVEYRRFDGEKEVRKYHLPESEWVPVFTGLTPSMLGRVWDGGDVWLVEGVFDLALAHVTPERDAVLAAGGAKITPDQLAFLCRFLSPGAMVHVVFDEDETGQKMAHGYIHPETKRRVWGVAERLRHAGLQSRVVQYRGGKDPGAIWERGGVSALRRSFGF